jgi:hypothetical protein
MLDLKTLQDTATEIHEEISELRGDFLELSLLTQSGGPSAHHLLKIRDRLNTLTDLLTQLLADTAELVTRK